MKKGYSYKKLPESNVLFVCTFDPFEKGLSKYTFKEQCEENSDIILGDGTTKVFYNCCYIGEDISDELRSYYEYVETGRANSALTKDIEEAVKKARRNESWRDRYMREWNALHDARDDAREEGREEGRKEGREEGRKEERKNTERERRRAEEAEKRVKELEALLAAKS